MPLLLPLPLHFLKILFTAFLEQLVCAFPLNHTFGASMDFDPSKSGAQGGQFLRRIFAPNVFGSGGTL